MSSLTFVLDFTVLASCVASAGLVALRLRAAQWDEPRFPRAGLARRIFGHPWTGFLFVCLLLFANQILFNAYVHVAHQGNPQFVARYLPHGWFALAPGAPPVAWLSAHLPPGSAGLQSLSVLRVNAFLELPFTLFAYLSAARLFGAALERALLRLAPLAAVSFTVTFCAIEWALRNPWTFDDLAIRAGACVVFIVFFAVRVRRAGPGAVLLGPGAPRLAVLLLALAGTALLGVAVLGMYDLTLLYNLGHWSRSGEGLVFVAAAAGVTVVFGIIHALEHAPPPARVSGASVLFATLLQVFTALFFVPSLPIRYRLSAPVAQLAALGLIALTAVLGGAAAVRTLRSRGLSPGLAALSLALGFAAGGALAAVVPLPGLIREGALLARTALLLPPALVVAAAVDSLLARRSARS